MTLEDRLQVRRQLEDAHHEIAKSCALREEVCIEQTADTMDRVLATEARTRHQKP